MTQEHGFDFAVSADDLKRHVYSFRLMPTLWDKYRGPDDLEWQCVPFDRTALNAVPNASGVYAFCVRPSIGGNLCGSYLFYVGMTERSLRVRCREYLASAEANRERPKVAMMLRHFFGKPYLRFCFATVSDGASWMIEQSLLEATVPPACTAFPASIRPAVAAL